MSKEVVIFGTGDFARVADVYLSQDSPHRIAAFTVNEEHLAEREFRGRPVIPFEQINDTHPPDRYAMFVAIGFSRANKSRAEVCQACKQRGYGLISYVNSKAVQWGEVEIGENCFIFENNVIQPFVKIGSDVILWSGNHIGHDAVIGDHCFIASHAVVSGNVEIGPYSFIGVNATIRDGVHVAAENVIGAGVLIMKDTQPRAVYRATPTQPSRVTSDRLRNI